MTVWTRRRRSLDRRARAPTRPRATRCSSPSLRRCDVGDARRRRRSARPGGGGRRPGTARRCRKRPEPWSLRGPSARTSASRSIERRASGCRPARPARRARCPCGPAAGGARRTGRPPPARRRCAAPRSSSRRPVGQAVQEVVGEHPVDAAPAVGHRLGHAATPPCGPWCGAGHAPRRSVIGGRCASAGERRRALDELGVVAHRLARLNVSVSSMPTRRWPPAASAASATGSVVRPIPVADQVAPGRQRLRRRRPARRPCRACPPGTPMTRSQWTWPPYGGPVLVEQPVAGRCTWPRSNSSNSGTTSRSWVSR